MIEPGAWSRVAEALLGTRARRRVAKGRDFGVPSWKSHPCEERRGPMMEPTSDRFAERLSNRARGPLEQRARALGETLRHSPSLLGIDAELCVAISGDGARFLGHSLRELVLAAPADLADIRARGGFERPLEPSLLKALAWLAERISEAIEQREDVIRAKDCPHHR